MALWVCGKCGSRFSVGAAYCPECSWSARYGHEEGTDMARVTVNSGVSDILRPDETDETEFEREQHEGSEDVSPGSNSEASPERLTTQPSESERQDRKPAGKTGNHSATPRKAARSTVASADVSTTGSK